MQWHCGGPGANIRCSRSRSRDWKPLPSSRASMGPAGIGWPAASFAAAAAAASIAAAIGIVALVPAQTVPLPLCRRRGRPNCRASAAWLTGWLRLSRSETADRTARTSPAGRLMLPAALLRLAAQHCGFFLDPTMIWKGSPGAFPPVGCCWPRLGSITVVGCRFALTCVDSGQHHKRGHEEDRSLPSHEEKKQRVT